MSDYVCTREHGELSVSENVADTVRGQTNVDTVM